MRFSPPNLQDRLSDLSGRSVMLMITDNSSSILTVHENDSVLEVRAHRMFLDMPDPVLQAMGRWLAGRKLKRDIIQEYIDENRHTVKTRAPEIRRPAIRTRGRFHNLDEIRDNLNATYLEGRSAAPVTWGRKVTRKQVRSVRLGTYDPVLGLITLSRRLDRADIPRYMVEYVMFHEMLHEVLGIGERPDGKRDIHGRTFRFMEQTFPHYARAKAFEKKKWG